mmetsp:Transcript_14240/g.35328  ORF Transcript_14240/g.35328 Transcript_14240/m.35328 type:complete len:819 (+) Transcript_14240:104-2560(+)
MYVVKRDGTREKVAFDKITERIRKLCFGLNKDYLVPERIAQKVVEGVFDGVHTTQLDNLAAETCAYMSQMHPDFSLLAARVAISNLQKMTSSNFEDTSRKLYEYQDDSGRSCALLSKEYFDFASEHWDLIQETLKYERDFNYDYFGFKTLERSYLLRVNGVIVERPQHLIMRCALGIHMGDIKGALETYEWMSNKYFTHATPTLFNAGTPKNQMSSCFLLSMAEDSIDGIYDTLKRCAKISKSAGGIGVAISNVRASGSYIRGTNGYSNGLVPMLRVFNDTARYVDQGGGRRKGAFAMYLEPWHADVFDFLDLKKNHGKEENRARDLFYALWIPDLFMKRVMNGEDWTLFCPDETRDANGKTLQDFWGEEFEKRFEELEKAGKGRKTITAQSLFNKICESQMETGVPYMCYKDVANRKSNQQNLGTIKCSNLCTEIFEYTDPGEVAVCNLASIALNMFTKEDTDRALPITERYNFDLLKSISRLVTKNLNKVIDNNYYPVPEARASNMRHRPIGIGVQGLADAFMKLKYPFESEQAKELNKMIFETIYFGACEASCELAERDGPYETWKGCPAEQGKLQFDLWGVVPSQLHDWASLKEKIKKHGMRNSLLLAPMPTASTAQILGNNESFEPYTQNIYVRRVLSGEFVQVNRHLLKDLIDQGIWNKEMKQRLIAHNGSVQAIDEIPAETKELYKTCWEIRQKRILELAADRGAYIDQSQSLNIHMQNCSIQKLTSMHFYGWKLGLKTGQYYLRTKAAVEAIQFTVEKGAAAGQQETTTTSTPGSGGGAAIDATLLQAATAKIAAEQEQKSKYECVGCGS